MQQPSTENDSIFVTPEDGSAQKPGEEPQRRERERSGILGEPAGTPPGSEGGSDGSERDDPLHEQVPDDGVDHWRR
jgi:hypothetical protein